MRGFTATSNLLSINGIGRVPVSDFLMFDHFRRARPPRVQLTKSSDPICAVFAASRPSREEGSNQSPESHYISTVSICFPNVKGRQTSPLPLRLSYISSPRLFRLACDSAEGCLLASQYFDELLGPPEWPLYEGVSWCACALYLVAHPACMPCTPRAPGPAKPG